MYFLLFAKLVFILFVKNPMHMAEKNRGRCAQVKTILKEIESARNVLLVSAPMVRLFSYGMTGSQSEFNKHVLLRI